MTSMDWISIIGSYASLVGVGIAILQIRKVAKLSEATKSAIQLTHATLTKNVFTIELSAIVKMVDEIKLNIRICRFDAALLRVSDIIAQLQQYKSLPLANENSNAQIFNHACQQLVVLRDSLENRIANKGSSANLCNANRILSRISDELYTIVGDNKFNPPTGV